MEIYELRYFLAVAKSENIHRASEDIHISPASLSKAIGRLEEELGVALFKKSGRGIQLTPEGRKLSDRASSIVMLEESVKLEISGGVTQINVALGGEEILLSKYGVDLAHHFKAVAPQGAIQFITTGILSSLDF